jgi:hypothetical protein
VIEALFEAAPKLHRQGHWRVLENTLDALAEYVELYGNKVPLRQAHYRLVYKDYDWPTPSGVTHCQKEHGIAGFQAMIERAASTLGKAPEPTVSGIRWCRQDHHMRRAADELRSNHECAAGFGARDGFGSPGLS